jgi:hypothetical protein
VVNLTRSRRYHVWISNARNNFAPFAGFMLVGCERTRRGENGEALDGEVDDVRAADRSTDSEMDEAPV